MGRGSTFDDASERTGISEAVLINIFEKFVTSVSEDFYEKYGNIPVHYEEVACPSREFYLDVLIGTITSMEAANIVHKKIG